MRVGTGGANSRSGRIGGRIDGSGGMVAVAGYGSWRSPITAELVSGAQVGLAQPRLDRDTAYWLEVRPEEGGRTVLVRRPIGGARRT